LIIITITVIIVIYLFIFTGMLEAHEIQYEKNKKETQNKRLEKNTAPSLKKYNTNTNLIIINQMFRSFSY